LLPLFKGTTLFFAKVAFSKKGFSTAMVQLISSFAQQDAAMSVVFIN